MFVELPQELILMTAGSFVVGWLLSSISSRIGERYRAKKRDSRDDRIRSLEAELRVAHTDNEKAREKITEQEKEIKQTIDGAETRDNVIADQMDRIEAITRDLRDSVMKTRELRYELTDRATENIKSEVKLREVETELSVAQASTELITTGILDYTTDPDDDDGENDLSKAAT